MFFAKALCAISILSLTNLGKSQHLKTYNNTSFKRVVYMVKGKNLPKKVPRDPDGRFFAEQSREFLERMLNVWATKHIEVAWYGYRLSVKEETKVVLNYNILTKDQEDKLKGKGIYFICCTTDKNGVYPLYVGMTARQTFYDRLNQHKRKDVLADIRNSQWGHGFCKKFIFYVKEVNDPLTTKYLESIFLAAFNFPRNTQENIQTRNLDKSGTDYKDEGKKHLNIIVEKMKAYLENVINEFKKYIS